MIDQRKIVRLPELLRLTGLSRPTLYRKMAGGTFPPKVQLSVNCVGWYEADVEAWLANPAAWCAAA